MLSVFFLNTSLKITYFEFKQVDNMRAKILSPSNFKLHIYVCVKDQL